VLHYVRPELVANFEFATWTKTGRIRKPATFLGFRYDKDPRDVVREVTKNIPDVPEERSESTNELLGVPEESPNLTQKKSNRDNTEGAEIRQADAGTVYDLQYR
jgi:bifunctional non-homologous end joining protein LigD